MDFQISFIFVSMFSFASVVLLLIYRFSIKEKTYEEALAEQRQQSSILLGAKPKLKEKKTKKPTKKNQTVIKEQKISEENVISSEQEQTDIPVEKSTDIQKKPHVEFKEGAEDVSVKTAPNKKQNKKNNKVRPILINKEKNESDPPQSTNIANVAPANHFEELHPKDDFELLRSTIVEKTEESPKEEQDKSVKNEVDPKKNVQKKPAENEVVAAEKENVQPPVVTIANGFINHSGKEKKKKKNELNALVGNISAANMSVLLDLVRKAELSRSEVQILIDLLLNKQHEAPAVIDEWSEGKSDPVQKLKKQLAEKEKLLLEEQQMVANTQAKLREIRVDHQNEKSGLLQKIRNLEDILQNKQLEVTRNFGQIQQLQAQIKEELVKNHKLREEHGALQIQRQQIEMRLSQTQESEAIINQLQSEVQELSTINNQLRMDLGHLSEENMKEKERGQAFIVQLNNYQKELEQKMEMNRQLDESLRQLKRDLETFSKQENDFKVEISRLNGLIQKLNEDKRRMEHTTKQYYDDLQKHKEESSKIITQLTADLRRSQEESKQMQIAQMNGSSQEKHELEILNLHNELSSVKTQLDQTEKQNEKELKTANALAEKLQREIDELKTKYEEEKSKVGEQKAKNNELRERNWKVMEALNAAESRIKNKTAIVSSITTKSEEDIQREFIQRLFPEIKDEEIANAELYKKGGINFIKKYVDNLRMQNNKSETDEDLNQLKLQAQHYKNVIDNTERMLNKLQKHIEQEEIKWRMQLAAKSDEIETLKESHQQELQDKIAWLNKELEDKSRILAQHQHCNSEAQNVH